MVGSALLAADGSAREVYAWTTPEEAKAKVLLRRQRKVSTLIFTHALFVCHQININKTLFQPQESHRRATVISTEDQQPSRQRNNSVQGNTTHAGKHVHNQIKTGNMTKVTYLTRQPFNFSHLMSLFPGEAGWNCSPCCNTDWEETADESNLNSPFFIFWQALLMRADTACAYERAR